MGSLSQKIQGQIAQSNGWIGFDEFMNLALYSPGLGYYCSGATPFGPQGDFETAPMLGSWLSESIWRWSQPLRAAGFVGLREFGGGRGDLAAGVMAAAQREGQSPTFDMIELSAGAQALQRQRLSGFQNVSWHSALAGGFSGLVIANELLDAMPVKSFEWQGGDQVLEWGISSSDPSQACSGSFKWAARPASEELRRHVSRRAHAAANRGLPWPAGYRGEACLWTAPWLQSLADSMQQGAVLLIDYGFCESELDQPGRLSGTLCAHSRHRRIDSFDALLERVGEQDLTAHVNFSAIASQAQQAGFEVHGFVTQARFLMNTGILERAQQAFDQLTDERERVLLSQSLQKLLVESEMGEVFKVMLLSKGLPDSVRAALYEGGFAAGDRCACL